MFDLGPLVLAVALACGSTAAQPGTDPPMDAPPIEVTSMSLGQPFELAVGGSVTIAETGLQVSLLGVREDSRCPAQVACIWAGRVSIELEVSASGAAAEAFVLSTCCPAPDSAHYEYAGHTIDLQAVSPQPPPPGMPIAQQDYRVQLMVSTL